MEHKKIDENVVMQFYLDQLADNRIIFLQKKQAQRNRIAASITQLMNETKMNNKIQIAVGLWKDLFDAAMSYLNPNKQGYDKIFAYFDAYVEFEELIFASDSFYRDHTLHCMWVYFLGEYIRRNEEFHEIFIALEDAKNMLDAYRQLFIYADATDLGTYKDFDNGLKCMEKVMELDEATRCIAALCHDLGYPLKKIEKINKSITKVLPAFAIKESEGFHFEYSNTQTDYIVHFIDFISRSFNGTININLKKDKEFADALWKVFKTNDSGTQINGIDTEYLQTLDKKRLRNALEKFKFKPLFDKSNHDYLTFSNDFEEYQHGIMSSFLLFKNLDAFSRMNFNEYTRKFSAADTLSSSRMLNNATLLAAMAQHTNESYRIYGIDPTSFLTFIDELEEFSRISRASQNREYVEEFCDSYIFMEDGWFNVIFEFNNANLDSLDPARAFKGRCKRFLSLFAIDDLDEHLKIRLQCVGKLPTDQNTYTLEIANKHADILINGESVSIPEYLKSNQFYTMEEYAEL